ncbi:MAG: hypothetical protein ABIP51_18905 [Bacteroidia bacterium]
MSRVNEYQVLLRIQKTICKKEISSVKECIKEYKDEKKENWKVFKTKMYKKIAKNEKEIRKLNSSIK